MTEAFDAFVAGELKKLKERYPDAHILRHVSMVSEEIIEEEDSDIPEELDTEQETPDEGIYDEAKEFD